MAIRFDFHLAVAAEIGKGLVHDRERKTERNCPDRTKSEKNAEDKKENQAGISEIFILNFVS